MTVRLQSFYLSEAHQGSFILLRWDPFREAFALDTAINI